MKYFGGVEGGATHSKLVICNEKGETVASVAGPGTNHWQVGIPECAKRIALMVDSAKQEAAIPTTTKLTSLGLSLSGCEEQETNNKLENELRNAYPDVSDKFVVCSDTIGSVFTASQIGGMVLIAGTGSNALISNPDGSTYRCGGWGNMLGDEGSAWWISHRAIKYVFDDMDNFIKAPYPIGEVWRLIQDHFCVSSQTGLLDHCYGNFDKPFFAGLCKKLSTAARDGDKLAAHIFDEAGIALARCVHALLPKIQDILFESGELSVVCVGSVWLSWDLLSNSFIKQLNTSKLPFGLKLLRITKTMAYGATYLAADHVKFAMPRNYQENYYAFYNYKPGTSYVNGSSIVR